MARKIVDSNDVETAQPSAVEFDTVYAPEGVEVDIVTAPSNGGGDAAMFEELKFMEEVVEVMVHESTDENAVNPIFTAVNGVAQYFFRGTVQAVKRKYVNILASCKEHNISTPEYTAKDGSRAVGIRRTSSLKYPFSVISDPNPRGAAWLRSVLAAPT
jgi:hypothetical protein